MSILTALKDLTDPRRNQSIKFLLHEVVFVSLLAILSGADSYRKIHAFAEENNQILQENFKITWKDPPAYTTIRNILLIIDIKELNVILKKQALSYIELLGSTEIHLAIDGKSIRGSYDNMKDQQCAHILNAFITNHNLIISQNNVREKKTNEIPVAQEIIPQISSEIDINIINTLDALHAQKDTVRLQALDNVELLVQVKSNQKALLNKCITRASINKDYETFVQRDSGHGRSEIRTTTVYTGIPNYFSNFWRENIKTVIKVERVRIVKNTFDKKSETSSEESYYVCTKKLSAKKASDLIIGHWGVENRAHHVLDQSFNEDNSRIRVKPEIFCLLRCISLNILRMNDVNNVANCMWRNAVNWRNLLKLDFLL
jgi:predicted transposase YbfD/YdcC